MLGLFLFVVLNNRLGLLLVLLSLILGLCSPGLVRVLIRFMFLAMCI